MPTLPDEIRAASDVIITIGKVFGNQTVPQALRLNFNFLDCVKFAKFVA